MRIIRDLLQKHWHLWLLLLGATLWKIALYQLQAFPFNADEAIVGLMAKHILAGERPLFFYGQAYMGSLDAWLVAGGFLIFGQHVWIIRAVQTILYAGTISLWYLFAYRVTQSIGRATLTAMLLAIPPVLLTLYTTVSLGGYGEALCIGSACLVLATTTEGRIPWKSCLLGFLAGFGVWVFPLSLVYSIPATIIFVYRNLVAATSRNTRWLIMIALILSMVAGAIPLLLGVMQYGTTLMQEMGGGAIAGTLQGDFIQILWIRLVGLILFGTTVVAGFRPPWEIRWLALPLLPVALVLWLGAIFSAWRSIRVQDSSRIYRFLMLGCASLFALTFLATPFGNDPSGRYFLPLYPIGAMALAGLLHMLWQRNRFIGMICSGLMVVYFGVGTLECALRIPPGITTQFDAATQLDNRDLPKVIAFLEAHGETRGYTDYWVSFPLAFQSNEELIFTARLPYHPDLRFTIRDDRYAPYDDAVEASLRIAFITARNPLLDARLQAALLQNQITYHIEQIGDFTIYYGLSRVIRPNDIDLTVDTSY